MDETAEQGIENQEMTLVEVVPVALASEAQEEIVEEIPEIDEEMVQAMTAEQKCALIEALIFACGEPLSIPKLSEASKLSSEDIRSIVGIIEEKYKVASSGFELVCVAEQYQFRTKSRYCNFVRALKASAPRRLSNAALETVSIIAYRQPIVKSDIERIRGVDATPTIKTLIERSLVKIVGHQQTVGQPALYGTTDDFLKLFGLKSLSQLPTLRDLEELERDPGETEVEVSADAAPTNEASA